MSWLEDEPVKKNVKGTFPPSTKSEVEPETKLNNFDFTEETDEGKEVYTLFGMKGSGKTTLALSFPGKILALSFDNKTTIVKNNFYNNDDRIKVFNATKYLDESPNKILDSNEKTYNFIHALLDEVATKEEFNWIVFDCADLMTTVCEMVMRKRNKVSPYGGVANRNIWKERKSMLNSIHKKALTRCKKGVIYTLYTDKDEIIDEGDIIIKKDVPKWVGNIMTETDFVIKTELNYTKEKGKVCTAHIWSSKNDKKLRTGEVIDVTDFKNKLFGG